MGKTRIKRPAKPNPDIEHVLQDQIKEDLDRLDARIREALAAKATWEWRLSQLEHLRAAISVKIAGPAKVDTKVGIYNVGPEISSFSLVDTGKTK